EVHYGPRDEHLAGFGLGRHSLADVHRDPTHVLVAHLDLAGVQTGPYLDAEAPNRVADGTRGADRPAGTVEGRQRTVAHRLDMVATEPFQLSMYHCVVAIERLGPAPVADIDARSVDRTMSVNNTVANTRSSCGIERFPVRNSSTVASRPSASPSQKMSSH